MLLFNATAWGETVCHRSAETRNENKWLKIDDLIDSVNEWGLSWGILPEGFSMPHAIAGQTMYLKNYHYLFDSYWAIVVKMSNAHN